MKMYFAFYIGSFLIGLTLGAMGMRVIMNARFRQEIRRRKVIHLDRRV